MSELSPRSRSVLESVRRELAPSIEHRRRMRETILERAVTARAGQGDAEQAGGSVRLGWTTAGKLAGLSLVVLVAGFAASSLRSSEPAALPPRVEPPVVVASAPVSSARAIANAALVETADPSPGPALLAPAPPKPPREMAPSKPAQAEVAKSTAHALEEEYRMIDTAHSAVSTEQWERALSLLDAHQQRFPRGQLAQQRERLRVEVLVAQGRLAEARNAAVLFRQQFPNGILRPSVERALVDKPEKSPPFSP